MTEERIKQLEIELEEAKNTKFEDDEEEDLE